MEEKEVNYEEAGKLEREIKRCKEKNSALEADVQCFQKLLRDMKKHEADKLVTLNYQAMIARQTTEELLKKCKKMESIIGKICDIVNYEEVPTKEKINLIRKEISKYGN